MRRFKDKIGDDGAILAVRDRANGGIFVPGPCWTRILGEESERALSMIVVAELMESLRIASSQHRLPYQPNPSDTSSTVQPAERSRAFSHRHPLLQRNR